MASNIMVKIQVSHSLTIWLHCIERRVLMGGSYPSEYEVDAACSKWVTVAT